jgi:CO/xanthine dehydrogenase FAD-binding subunit
MISIEEYIRPKSLDEAYSILTEDKDSTIIGGGAFIRLSNKSISKAIDLQNLGLRYIADLDDGVEIGSETTFGDLEVSPLLNKLFDGYISSNVKDIWSFQMRNIVTVGGTIYPKLGFSDLITMLMALDVKVTLYKAGEMPLEKYLQTKLTSKDIMIKLTISKKPIKANFKFMRNSYYDFSILNVSTSLEKETSNFRIAVGARPGVATVPEKALKLLNSENISKELIEKVSELASEELSFASDIRGSKEYRKELCKTLVKRSLMEVAGL